ncbi:MAG: translesion error-prone DNA polymerase V autoproteolytic subunit [Methylococcaceae bacterium]|nr:translesion error-prone DNA polymerase V autoproteolytic subunit [Methylococcaceae bacterium]
MMQQTIQPPLFLSKVSAGFPSPAEDYKDKPLCLNEHLVERPAATLFIRLADNGMVGDHYHPGDLLIVDKSMTPRDGSVVVANVSGDLMIRRLVIRGRSGWLFPANPDYRPIELKEGLEYHILGVVLHRIHSC